jgi:predicted nucleic acid-binding protein
VNAVVDTNVVAYFVLGTDKFVEEARGFITALDQAWAPALWEAELANVLWMATRHNVLTLEEAGNRLTLADGLGVHVVPNRTLWQGALVRAHQSKVAVNDTLFVELAVREQLPLATFDATLLRAFPDVAVRPGAVTPK